MDSVSDVDIDPSGSFKYILIQVTDKSSGKQKLIVRGYGDCDYHGNKRHFKRDFYLTAKIYT